MNPNKPPAPPVPTGRNPMLPTGPPKPDPFQPWRNEQFFGKKPVGVTPPEGLSHVLPYISEQDLTEEE